MGTVPFVFGFCEVPGTGLSDAVAAEDFDSTTDREGLWGFEESGRGNRDGLDFTGTCWTVAVVFELRSVERSEFCEAGTVGAGLGDLLPDPFNDDNSKLTWSEAGVGLTTVSVTTFSAVFALSVIAGVEITSLSTDSTIFVDFSVMDGGAVLLMTGEEDGLVRFRNNDSIWIFLISSPLLADPFIFFSVGDSGFEFLSADKSDDACLSWAGVGLFNTFKSDDWWSDLDGDGGLFAADWMDTWCAGGGVERGKRGLFNPSRGGDGFLSVGWAIVLLWTDGGLYNGGTADGFCNVGLLSAVSRDAWWFAGGCEGLAVGLFNAERRAFWWTVCLPESGIGLLFGDASSDGLTDVGGGVGFGLLRDASRTFWCAEGWTGFMGGLLPVEAIAAGWDREGVARGRGGLVSAVRSAFWWAVTGLLVVVGIVEDNWGLLNADNRLCWCSTFAELEVCVDSVGGDCCPLRRSRRETLTGSDSGTVFDGPPFKILNKLFRPLSVGITGACDTIVCELCVSWGVPKTGSSAGANCNESDNRNGFSWNVWEKPPEGGGGGG
jgi:hypothetical protein